MSPVDLEITNCLVIIAFYHCYSTPMPISIEFGFIICVGAIRTLSKAPAGIIAAIALGGNLPFLQLHNMKERSILCMSRRIRVVNKLNQPRQAHNCQVGREKTSPFRPGYLNSWSRVVKLLFTCPLEPAFRLNKLVLLISGACAIVRDNRYLSDEFSYIGRKVRGLIAVFCRSKARLDISLRGCCLGEPCSVFCNQFSNGRAI